MNTQISQALRAAIADDAFAASFQTLGQYRQALVRILAAEGAGQAGQVAKGAPVELMGVAEQLKKGAGFWQPCSGCYDTEDGHPTQQYAYSEALGCALGNGCSECGGIGAVWDNTDYEAMARDWDKDDAPIERAVAPAEVITLLQDAARAWNNEAESELDAAMERIECFLLDQRAQPQPEAKRAP